MSRRKQTNPFKVNWPFHTTGFSGPQHTSEMDTSDDFGETLECHSGSSREPEEHDSITDDSDSDLDKENSSGSSADDNVSSSKGSRCLAHGGDIKEHTSAVGSSKSYVCPVCGRALSSPGSLGRHLLIHSDDRLSNCAVCGARFTDTNNFNREKLKEFLGPVGVENSSGDQVCSMGQPLSVGPSPGPALPPLPDSLLSSGPSLPSLPDALSPSPSLPPLPDLLSPMPVYPAGVLLVCNSCVAYQQLVGGQSPSVRKWAARRKNEPVEARLQRLERERVAKKSKRACETPEERELRRLRDREAKRMQRLQETEEQRARRLQRDREAMRLKRANETPERRQARLVREREAKRLKRRLEKIDPSLRTQIEHDPAAMAALTADMNLFQFPFTMPVSSMDNGLFMKLP
ncbi:zinc finger protein 821 isoform X3 [Electrophorus electricus]|uniref:zinc finger protein 821 isoform X3 n=1 Tax=Electrophorus electricus TaxID=8005 RepID=UPI000F0A64E0|nr:zinc finger protein 821 isoform X3 [Electrophorus electricus]